eukprot:SAG22_NODE_1059_length_5764_cov_3.282966_3_plen_63_part_00
MDARTAGSIDSRGANKCAHAHAVARDHRYGRKFTPTRDFGCQYAFFKIYSSVSNPKKGSMPQ